MKLPTASGGVLNPQLHKINISGIGREITNIPDSHKQGRTGLRFLIMHGLFLIWHMS